MVDLFLNLIVAFLCLFCGMVSAAREGADAPQQTATATKPALPAVEERPAVTETETVRLIVGKGGKLMLPESKVEAGDDELTARLAADTGGKITLVTDDPDLAGAIERLMRLQARGDSHPAPKSLEIMVQP